MPSIKSFFANIFAAQVTKKINAWASDPIPLNKKSSNS